VNADYQKLLQRLKTFICREYAVQREQLEKQWLLPLALRDREFILPLINGELAPSIDYAR